MPYSLEQRIVEAFDNRSTPLTVDEICQLPELKGYSGKTIRQRVREASQRMAEASYLKLEGGKFSRGTRPILWGRLDRAKQAVGGDRS